MRRRLLSGIVATVLSVPAANAQGGVPARPDAADYAAHQILPEGTLATVLLPADQVARIFSRDVSKRYLVVEVAAYPVHGGAPDLLILDFDLKDGDARSYPLTPMEVAWRGKRPPNPSVTSRIPHVGGELGVGYGTRTNPATGRTARTVDTWGAVGVDNRPAAPSPSATGSADRTWQLEGRLQSLELPEGPSTRPVAGYLYFPALTGKQKNIRLTLEYAHGGERLSLPLQIR
jgi:hypothetical protein